MRSPAVSSLSLCQPQLANTHAADLTLSDASAQPPPIAQFGANSAREFARAAALVAPFVSGVDLNCGCPQSWACAETLGAALMDRRELVRDMAVEARAALRADGWHVGLDGDILSPRGRSISVKIRVHKDLRCVRVPPSTYISWRWL